MSNLVLKQAESGLESLFNRAVEVREGNPVDSAIKQRIAQAAQELDRTGLAQAHLDVMIEAMSKAVTLLYRVDADGQPPNIDRATGRILPPMPWGESGWKRWGVRNWEARALRSIMIKRSIERRRKSPLFYYNAETMRWYLNFEDYSTLQLALQWVQSDGPKLAEWRSAINESRERAAERMQKRRGR